MRNTDRGLDNWMIKIDWKSEEVSIVADPPKSDDNSPKDEDSDEHLRPAQPVNLNADRSTSTSSPYRRHEMVAVSRTGTPLSGQEPQASVQIGAIDNSLSWPWKHPDAVSLRKLTMSSVTFDANTK